MPMNWNAEADARLLGLILTTHDVKINYQQLAAHMGPDCTPKALTHRIANIKKKGTPASGTTTPSTPSASSRTKSTSTPKSTTRTTKSATAAKKPAPITPRKRTHDHDDSDDAESSGVSSSGSASKPRNFDEEDDSGVENGVVSGEAGKDRSGLRRSASTPKRGAYVDGDDEGDEGFESAREEQVAKKVKVEVEEV